MNNWTRGERELVRTGLELRDKLGGHHFLQAEVGGAKWVCRDCNIIAQVDQQVWWQWMVFWKDTPENVRRVLDRKSCG